MPEIQLYEFPLAGIPIDLQQIVTQVQISSDVSKQIWTVLTALPQDVRNPPTTWLEPLLFATHPRLLRGFSWQWDASVQQMTLSPALIWGELDSLGNTAALVHSWTGVWRNHIRQKYPEALAQAESLHAYITELWQQKTLLTTSQCCVSDIVLEENGSISGESYDLVPAILLRKLIGATTPIVEGQNAVWGLVAGRAETFAVTQILQAANGGLFAYRLDAALQTIASTTGEFPVVQLSVSQQRYPDGAVVERPQNEHSILIRTGENTWCKVASNDFGYLMKREAAVGAAALPRWDDLPSLDDLRAAPQNYLDDMRVVYLTGMTYLQEKGPESHPLEVGMSFEEQRTIFEPVIDLLELETSTTAHDDMPLSELLRNLGRQPKSRAIWSLDRLPVRNRAAQRRDLLNERIKQTTSGLGLEIVVVVHESHTKLIDDLIPEAVEAVFGTRPEFFQDDVWSVLPQVTLRFVRLSADEVGLFAPIAYEDVSEYTASDGRRHYRMQLWKPAYRDRYRHLVRLLRQRLPSTDNKISLAIVEKPQPPGGHATAWQDVKGAIRAAFAELGYLSQFVNPYFSDKSGLERIRSDVIHRLRQGLLDGLRQLGVVLGTPSDLYELLDLPEMYVVSMTLMRTRERDIQYPVFSRLAPNGIMELRFPEASDKLSEWIPVYNAIPELIKHIWSTVDRLRIPGTYSHSRNNPSPLNIAPGKIVRYVHNILAECVPMVFVVPAPTIRNYNIWPQLSNKNLGIQKNQLILGQELPVQRDHPSWEHLLGIIRFRGPDSETPGYFPSSDRTGKQFDYLAPYGWVVEEDDLIRYLGVGVLVSTATNRETIHRDTHSLLHDVRQRPSGSLVEVGASHRYSHPRLIEFVPFFVSPKLGNESDVALARLAQCTRMMGCFQQTLNLPWPAHVAQTSLEDALDVIARYDKG